MDKILIEGGAPLHGEVQVSGAKNAALPLMAATLLSERPSVLHNVPRLNDVRTMRKLLERLGCRVHGEQSITVEPPTADRVSLEAPYELVKTMRASVLVLGPLAARFGRARVSLPGGCAIGARPIDQHLRGLEAMGARVTLEHGYVEVQAERLRGAHIVLDIPTVTGCENLMMAAALAEGRTVIENAAREPEVQELGLALQQMGVPISGIGSDVLTIDGVPRPGALDHTIAADRIEAGTFLVAAAITGGDVLVRGARAEHLDAVIAKLRACGPAVTIEPEGIRVRGQGRLRSFNITTQPYPGFPTDMQAQFMVLATCADGQSVIKEAIFENRFMHVPELARMGADIQTTGRVAIVRGPTPLSGATVMATDLRASASLVLAGLVAEGTTEVLRVYHLDRGYERIENKLRALGARIERAADR
jgi:UDP-N-acetylglucosamine 1-carboxyvinyltransferase